jgi:hypothetical protein
MTEFCEEEHSDVVRTIPHHQFCFFPSGSTQNLVTAVVGVPMENRIPMTRSDVAAELQKSKEEREYIQGGTTRTQPARGLQWRSSKTDLQLNIKDAA